ncbi:MAG: hypothetical protein WD356_06240 [Pseudomonadales bacterium]
MAAKRRTLTVFSLSFLDIMACGFGAVILIFILIDHATEVNSQEVNAELMAEVKKVEEALETDRQNLVQLRNTVEQTEEEVVTTDERIREITEQIESLETQIAAASTQGASQDDSVEQLKQEIKQLEEELASLEGSVAASEEAGESLRSFVGQGNRQYLTGLNVGGKNILILLDASASMLDRTIVNVVRRRNMSEDRQRDAPKWRRAVRTVEWIIANMPTDADFQFFTFNTQAQPIIEDTEGKWLKAVERENTDAALENLNQIVPKGGTSLHHAFATARNMSPQPDNIFLIIDSLPTTGLEANDKGTITGSERLDLFQDSLDQLPQNIPVNIILFPMEGDPVASPSFWRLAQMSGGSFLSPSEDWP